MLIVGCGVAAAQTSETNRLTQVLRGHENVVQNVAFSPDGTRIVTGSSDRTARIWIIE